MSFDLADWDTRANADAGVWFDVKIDGIIMQGDDRKPVQFLLMGKDAAAIEEARKGVVNVDTEANLACVFIKGWSSNFLFEGEKLKYSTDNSVKIGSIPVIARWIISEVAADAAFMSKAPKS